MQGDNLLGGHGIDPPCPQETSNHITFIAATGIPPSSRLLETAGEGEASGLDGRRGGEGLGGSGEGGGCKVSAGGG